jgi:RNA polymerase sigma-70 factor, ECF subfamily
MADISKDPSAMSELMRLAQAGNKQAYSRLFLKITPLLRSFVSQKISNRDDMEDIVQEILISIHKASHTFDTYRPFEVWMYTIARYRLNDHLRAHYKNQSLKDKILEESDYFYTDDYVTIDPEMNESISELMEALPEKQKIIVKMMKLEGYTAKETAEKLNMSETAVKVAAHRVYKQMAKKLKKE